MEENVREVLQTDVSDGIALLRLNRPAALNAMHPDLARALDQSLRAIPEDGSVRAIVLTGAGRAFCAGGDIRAMSAALDESPREFFLDLIDCLHGITRSLMRAPVPTVAAVNGVAAGFGLGLALSCDLVVASERAKFSMAHSQVGQIPDGGAWYLLPRSIGRHRALDLYLRRRSLDAETARDWGMVGEVLPAAGFAEAAREIAVQLAAGPGGAYREAKLQLLRSDGESLDDFLDGQRQRIAELGETANFAEGVRAFLDRRPPEFR